MYTVFENTGKHRWWTFETLRDLRSAKPMFKAFGLRFNGLVARQKAKDIDVIYVSKDADMQTPFIPAEGGAWQYNACGKLVYVGRE